MPQRETIDRLRNMIRDMEMSRPTSVEEIGSATSEDRRPRSLPSYANTEPGGAITSPYVGGLPDIPRLSPKKAFSEVAPAEITIEDGEHFRTIRSIFPGGAPPELKVPAEDVLPALRSLEPRLPNLDNWLYLDIETTGLMGAATVPFVVGFGEWAGDDFHVTQLFLTDRSDEEFLMAEVENRIKGRDTLVTFNGKAFDVPLLWGRFAMCGMRPPGAPTAHLDLLPLVRNMGKRPQYGQSLKEAMRRFTGTVRDGDIPGHLIPALYFIYEKDGDPSILEPVLKHNRLDVLDMVCLVWVLCHVVSGDPELGDAHALGGAGKLHLRKGNLDLARKCLETALSYDGSRGADPVAQKRLLGQVLRKQGDWIGAIEAFTYVVESGCAKDEDYLWLARGLELGPRDMKKSYDVVVAAIDRYRMLGQDPPGSLLRRLKRLERKLSSAG